MVYKEGDKYRLTPEDKIKNYILSNVEKYPKDLIIKQLIAVGFQQSKIEKVWNELEDSGNSKIVVSMKAIIAVSAVVVLLFMGLVIYMVFVVNGHISSNTQNIVNQTSDVDSTNIQVTTQGTDKNGVITLPNPGVPSQTATNTDFQPKK